MSDTIPAPAPAPAPSPVLGRCKWFDDKKGYGFLVVCEGPEAEADVFVHYKDVKPLVNTRRSLRKGEYVHMRLSDEDGSKTQAKDVTGVNGGPLMCDHFVRRSLEKTASAPAAPLLRVEGEEDAGFE